MVRQTRLTRRTRRALAAGPEVAAVLEAVGRPDLGVRSRRTGVSVDDPIGAADRERRWPVIPMRASSTSSWPR
jgi:hypothetical protein